MFTQYKTMVTVSSVYMLPIGFTVEYRDNCYGWIQQRSYGKRELFSFDTIKQAIESAWEYNND